MVPSMVGMNRRGRFERRFHRGLLGSDCHVTASGFIERYCITCRAQHQNYAEEPEPVCFDCGQTRNPYAAKNIRMSVDATGDPSTNPQRIREGTAEYNMGLPPVAGEIIGRDAYGQIKRKRRPVHNNELASARRAKEMAKQANLTPLETPRRAVGGR
jgi:hypothetical protein